MPHTTHLCGCRNLPIPTPMAGTLLANFAGGMHRAKALCSIWKRKYRASRFLRETASSFALIAKTRGMRVHKRAKQQSKIIDFVVFVYYYLK